MLFEPLDVADLVLHLQPTQLGDLVQYTNLVLGTRAVMEFALVELDLAVSSGAQPDEIVWRFGLWHSLNRPLAAPLQLRLWTSSVPANMLLSVV